MTNLDYYFKLQQLANNIGLQVWANYNGSPGDYFLYNLKSTNSLIMKGKLKQIEKCLNKLIKLKSFI